jgi:hypothetical protein
LDQGFTIGKNLFQQKVHLLIANNIPGGKDDKIVHEWFWWLGFKQVVVRLSPGQVLEPIPTFQLLHQLVPAMSLLVQAIGRPI